MSILALLLQQQPSGVTFINLNKEPDPSLAWLILSTVGLIGLLLAITVGIGAGIGLVRLWIRKRFPHNRFNGAEDEPTIRLHLHEEPGDLN
jgi:hypothetical protein